MSLKIQTPEQEEQEAREKKERKEYLALVRHVVRNCKSEGSRSLKLQLEFLESIPVKKRNPHQKKMISAYKEGIEKYEDKLKGKI